MNRIDRATFLTTLRSPRDRSWWRGATDYVPNVFSQTIFARMEIVLYWQIEKDFDQYVVYWNQSFSSERRKSPSPSLLSEIMIVLEGRSSNEPSRLWHKHRRRTFIFSRRWLSQSRADHSWYRESLRDWRQIRWSNSILNLLLKWDEQRLNRDF
jgi:hypothetical protein